MSKNRDSSDDLLQLLIDFEKRLRPCVAEPEFSIKNNYEEDFDGVIDELIAGRSVVISRGIFNEIIKALKEK